MDRKYFENCLRLRCLINPQNKQTVLSLTDFLVYVKLLIKYGKHWLVYATVDNGKVLNNAVHCSLDLWNPSAGKKARSPVFLNRVSQ